MASASPSLPLVQDDGPVKFHVSLNVSDLKKSQRFYAALLGVEPAKAYADYAKFELTSPPLVLSLKPSWAVRGGVLNHLGFRVSNPAARRSAVPPGDGGLSHRTTRRRSNAAMRTRPSSGRPTPTAPCGKSTCSTATSITRERSHGLAGMLPPLRALGFVESVRRGMGKSLGALRRLSSRRCRPSRRRRAATGTPFPPAAVGPR